MDQTTRRRVFKLRFPELDDLVVRARKPSYRGYRLLNRAVRLLGEDLRGARLTPDTRVDTWGLLFDAFADALISWDLTDDGAPVPATKQGVHGQDLELLLTVATAWYRQVVLRIERPAEQSPEPQAAVADDAALASIPFEVGNDALAAAGEQDDDVSRMSA